MATSQWSDYDEKMLSAFVAKPGKVPFYRDLYNRATPSGSPMICWKWSWWAFFGGVLFPLYRKTYMAAFAVFGINLLLVMFVRSGLPSWIKALLDGTEMVSRYATRYNEEMARSLALYVLNCSVTWLVVGVAIGGFVPYFIIKRYCDLKTAIESKYADEEDRVAVMARCGGAHKWVVKLAIALIVVVNLLLIFAVVLANA